MWRQFILDPDEEGWSDGEVYVTCEGPDMYQAGWSKHGATLNAPQRDTVLGSLEALRDVAIAMQIRLDTPRVFR